MRLPRCTYRTPGHRLPPRAGARPFVLASEHGTGALAPSGSVAGPRAGRHQLLHLRGYPGATPMCHQLQNDYLSNRLRDRTFEYGNPGDGGFSAPQAPEAHLACGNNPAEQVPCLCPAPLRPRPPPRSVGAALAVRGLPFLHSSGMFTPPPSDLGCPQNQSALSSTDMESTGCPLNLTLKVEEQEEEIQSRALESGPTDTQKVRICAEGGWVPALFDEVAIYFSDEEWDVLTEPQRALYREVMRMNYDTVLSLEFPFPKPDVISRLEGEGEAQDCDGWQLPGGTFPENEDADVKRLRLPRDIAELPEWSEGYPFYMAMGFPGYDLAADDLAAKFQFSRGMRRSYDAGFKLMVVEFAESTNNCQAAKQFGVLEKNVRDWRKVKPQLQNAHAMRRAFRGPKNGRFALVDQRVAEYVRYMQAKGDPITREAMQLKALEIAQEMNIPEKGFKASLGWCRRMMRRYDLSLRHKVPVPQQLPEDLTEKLVTYQRSVLALRRAHDYQVAQMGNADETPICLEVPSRVTVDNQGEKPVLVKTPGREKLKITAMLGVLADGRKLPPYIVLRGTYIPPGKFPSGMEIRCHRYGWMTEDLMQDWLEVVWRRRAGALPEQRGLLIVNGFRGHATDAVKSSMASMDTDMVVIPGGLTSQLQVLDVVVYKPLNDSVRAQYSSWLLAGNLALSPTGNAKKPPLGLFLEWVMVAWNSISSDSIVQGFKKCHISSALEDEDDVLWEIESELPGGGEPPKECDAESMTESH
ncbi:pogo transposable element with KRAB domain [Pteropus alecto]|uniref:pogo transposable element with KRAB domain n=1 Tax=Pteropus alecto TaxID=9402 RepID=UPI000D539FE7|nr:pogo transposable element with KRAB domain [Pteropus alecto]